MAEWWRDYPWRMIQTNLREIDMKDIDAEEYARQLRGMHATVAMINTAGILASYKTELPWHFQSPFLHGDQLQDIIRVCHREAIRVVARTDFSKVRRPIYEEHPDWACVYPRKVQATAPGRPASGEHVCGGIIEDYNGDVHCCVNGAYQQHYSLLTMREAVETLDIDGIFFNMGGYITHNYSHEYLGICQCDNCKKRFVDMHGLELPVREDMGDPIYRKYLVFKRITLADHKKKVVEVIRAARPDIAIARNTIDGTGLQRMESNTEIDRPLPHWQYSASENTKKCVTSWPGFVPSNSSVDFIGFFYRHVAVSPNQQELRLWQTLAHCGAPDYYLMGRLDNHRDRSAYEAVKRAFAFHEKHFEKTYRGLRPSSDVLLISGEGDVKEYRGWFRMLAEGHFLFDVLDLDRLCAVDLDSYDSVILPNIKYMSDDAAGALDGFVRDGGTILATGETAFYNDSYEKRDACALSSLGIREVKATRTDMRSALLDVDDKTRFPSMADRDLLYFGDVFIFADFDDNTSGLLKLIPPHNYGPPERCYWGIETDIPGLLEHRHGEGRTVYLPWLPGGLYYREGHDNTPVFIHDVLSNVMGVLRVEGQLSPMVEVSMAIPPDASFALLQLVNGSGHSGNSFFEPVMMRDITIEVPLDREPKQARCMAKNAPVAAEYRAEEKRATVRIPELKFFEAVKFSF